LLNNDTIVFEKRGGSISRINEIFLKKKNRSATESQKIKRPSFIGTTSK